MHKMAFSHRDANISLTWVTKLVTSYSYDLHSLKVVHITDLQFNQGESLGVPADMRSDRREVVQDPALNAAKSLLAAARGHQTKRAATGAETRKSACGPGLVYFYVYVQPCFPFAI